MKIKRLKIKLPASMKGVAEAEARAIAEAVGRQAAKGGDVRDVTAQSFGHRGVVLGAQVTSAMKGGRHGR